MLRGHMLSVVVVLALGGLLGARSTGADPGKVKATPCVCCGDACSCTSCGCGDCC